MRPDFRRKGSTRLASPANTTVRSRIEHGQIKLFLGYASRLGHALLDRELSFPEAWADDCDCSRRVGIPHERRFATKPQLAKEMVHRTLAAGVLATWGTGDRVYGDDRRLRMWLEAQP